MVDHTSGSPISRRAFLGVLGAGTGAVVLVACNGAAPASSAAASGATPATSTTTASGATTAVTAPPNGNAGQPNMGGTLTAGRLGDVANLDGHYWSPSGGLHVWLASSFQPTLQDYLRLKSDPGYAAQLLTPAAGMYQIQPNVTFQPLDNKVVRQALNYAIDRQRICDSVLMGLVGPEDLPWPPNSPAYEAAKNSLYAFDLDKAKSLLDQAGVSNLELDFVYAPTLPEYATLAQIYQSDLASIGVKLNVRSMDIAALFDAIHSQKYNGLYTLNDSWAAMQPISMLRAGASLNPRINNAGFHEDAYTQLTDQTAAEPDAAKRAQLYSQINDYILDQSFGMPVAPSTSRMVTPANVHGIEFRYNDVMYFGNTWIG